MATAISTAQPSIVLHDISWSTYQGLLSDLRDRSTPRLTYDRGSLEIMSPTREHEECNRAIAQFVVTAAEELGFDVLDLGSTTYRRDDLQRGFEPDSSFYIQSLDRVAGKTDIDLNVDPPPDLVIEVDITSHSIDKLPIYAEMAVPEIWRYDGRGFFIYLLDEVGGTYRQSDRSSAFPMITCSAIGKLIEDSKSLKSTAWLRKVREVVRAAGQHSS